MCDDGRVDDLIAFVTARLDEDEAVARGAARTDDGHGGRWLPVHFGAGGFDARVDEHIARHDPARALREVAAGRAILAAHAPDYTSRFGSPGPPECVVCITERDAYPEQWEGDSWPCLTLRQLAAIWSDHADYRPEWKP